MKINIVHTVQYGLHGLWSTRSNIVYMDQPFVGVQPSLFGLTYSLQINLVYGSNEVYVVQRIVYRVQPSLRGLTYSTGYSVDYVVHCSLRGRTYSLQVQPSLHGLT